MDFKRIKKLIQMVEDSNVSSLMVEEDNIKIEVKKEVGVNTHVVSNVPVTATAPQPTAAAAVDNTSKEAVKAEEKDASLVAIKSPMVGTFYSASSPEADPYVKVGDSIGSGDIVCVVEAMKLFNEIESDISGKIEKVLVENAAPIEYGQEIFLVRV